MWGGLSDDMYAAQAGQEGAGVPLHPEDQNGERPHEPEERYEGGPYEEQGTALGAESTAVASPYESESVDGTWGERDAGHPVRHRMAMDDYESLRRELTRLSMERTRSQSRADRGSLFRSVTGKSAHRTQSRRTRSSRAEDEDLEADEVDGIEEKEQEFQLSQFMREGHFEKRTEAGESTKKVGVIFKNLTVKGVGSTTSFVRTLPDAILGTFGPDLYKIICKLVPSLRFGSHGRTRDLIHDFTGVVRDGEMMLVLGRPGSGCSTFLKAIANDVDSFAGVTGDVSYGGISADQQRRKFRGEVNYNPEDDQHFPRLNVWQTLKFALLNKTKKKSTGDVPIIVDALLKIFGISHTKYTLVGNEYVRGVSGGERKRVSIAETLATKSTVVCWDNSTRGLDASTALDYANSLRIMTDISNRTTLVTLYQAGEGIYEVMDKVLVIDAGRMIFQGPAEDAKQYFIDLGFRCPDRQTTADFLTSITDPNERQFREGFEDKAPKTPEELEKVFKQSQNYQKVLEDVKTYERQVQESDLADAKQFTDAVREGKSKTVRNSSSYTVSYFRQVIACTQREFWLIWGDKTTLYTKAFIVIANGLIVGSLFYGQPLSTEGAFTRGGTLFFSILFLGWLQLTELNKAVSGRAIIARHKEYAFYRPSAVSIARVVTDFPVILAQVIPFSIIMYFMTNLDVDVSKFWIYMLFIYITTMCITALYRMFAALSPTIDDAVRFSGIALNLLIIYTGYAIPKPQLLDKYIWFGWMFYINPIAYAFEATLTNEFHDRVMDCSKMELLPQGPGASPQYQACSLNTLSSPLGSTQVGGEYYFHREFNYSREHLWRNFGVVIAWTVLYVLVTAITSELFSFAKSGGGALIFKKSKKAKQVMESPPSDEEKGGDAGGSNGSSDDTMTNGQSEEKALGEITKSESVFTWSNIEYTVPYQGGQRKLLNKVNGFAKPGLMVALMGASGAGKTTLLNTLAQRQTTGVVAGDMLVDGRPLGTEFQRGTGFCEQMDLHDGTSTIREALEFSAILRQERTVPRSEKIAYVDKIIDLLELGDLQDAIVSSLGVEQRKRLTIGVELAAKPSLLLFLDEPTSGLDSQSAFSIVRFLKKLSQAGQAIVCTIHQPSSMLIQQFDMILALNPGGNTFYFGPVGENGSAVIDYFAERGVTCPPSKNVAEFILETAAKGGKREDGKRLNWDEEWLNSRQNKEILDEIARIKTERGKIPPPEASTQHEFASPVYEQTVMLTKRLFLQYWRDPSYLYGKLFVSVILGIFNGFTFWQLGHSIQDMQDRMFTAFLIVLIPPTIVNAVVPKFYDNRELWELRELPSRIYGWVAFCTANIVTEIPAAIIGAVIYWVLWYWPTGLPSDSSTAGYVFLMTMLYFLFQASWGQWICAFAPSFTVISNVLPFFFVIFSLFNGVVRPYSQLSVFWRYWLYYLNPATYWIGGVMSATLSHVAVTCADQELVLFRPPPGTSCTAYTALMAQKQGYLSSSSYGGPNSGVCAYCPLASGTEYMKTLNVEPKDKWGYFGIFLGFCFSNWALVYFFIYTVRIRGWTFGASSLFGAVGKAVGKLVKLVAARKKKTGEPKEGAK
ncbi:MAG: hypothetical protein M1819_001165 [Sarea resinae]|nr:MAG: hypothetical protein M1819_001165 [Sarea resinae]